MTLGTGCDIQRGHLQRGGRRRRTIAPRAANAAACEWLEARRLLAEFVHTVTPGHSLVYLTAGQQPGQVNVRLDSETGDIDHQFFNQTGLDIIQAPPGATITFVDRVRAGLKPTVDPNATGDPFGILVRGGNNGTLKIDATGRTNDTLIEVIDSTALTATVKVTDSSNNMGFSRLGDGVNKLQPTGSPRPTIIPTAERG